MIPTDYTGPSVDPTDAKGTLRAVTNLLQTNDYLSAERLLSWALDFNPEHAGLLRSMSDLRWKESKVRESLEWAERALSANPGDAESYAYLALMRMRHGDYTSAAELVTQALELRPDHPPYLRRLAEIMSHLGRGPQAIEFAKRTVALWENDVASRLFLGNLQQRFGEFADAEASFQSAIALSPESASAARRKAEFHLALGEVSNAQHWAAYAKKIAPDDPACHDLEANIAIVAGDFPAAERASRYATALPGATSHHKLRLSDVLMRMGDQDGALKWAEAAISDNPDDVRGYYHIANLNMAMRETEKAILILQKASHLPVTSIGRATIMRNLSVIAQQSGRFQEAINWATSATEINPLDPDAHATLAAAYLNRGDFAAARRSALVALQLAPGNASHHRRLSEISWREGKHEEAFELAAASIVVAPADAQNYGHQASLLIRQGRREEAEASLSQAVKLSPIDVGILTKFSDLKMALGKQEDAFTLAEKAIAARPYDLTGYNHLASLQYRTGAIDAAVATLERATTLKVANGPLFCRLADFTSRLGYHEEARLWIAKAINVDPRNPNTYNQLASVALVHGEQEAAEAALTRAIEYAGTNPGFHRRLSDLLSRRGDRQGAIYWAERMIKDFEKDPSGFIQISNIHVSANRLDDAEAALSNARARSETPAQIMTCLHRRGDIAIRRNDLRSVLSCAEEAIRVAPYEATAYNYLASIHLSFGNLPSAEKIVIKGLVMWPIDGTLLRRMADIKLRQGQTGEALNFAHMSINSNPTDPHSHALLGNVLLTVPDQMAAARAFEMALLFAPDNSALKRQLAYLKITDAVSER